MTGKNKFIEIRVLADIFSENAQNKLVIAESHLAVIWQLQFKLSKQKVKFWEICVYSGPDISQLKLL